MYNIPAKLIKTFLCKPEGQIVIKAKLNTITTYVVTTRSFIKKIIVFN